MCHSYVRSTVFEERKAQEAKLREAEAREAEARAAREHRAGLVSRLLGDANRRAEDGKPETAPAREPAPAK